MPAWAQEWLGALALAAASGLAVWLSGISGRVHRHTTELAVLESKLDEMPKLLREIRDELKALRTESDDRAAKLYKHMDDMRLEVKADLAGKVDKA